MPFRLLPTTLPRPVSCLLVCLIVAAVGPVTGRAADSSAPKAFYVSTAGNDAFSGTLAAPNAQKSDGPFATLDRARDAIREIKKHGPLPAGGVTVWIRGGIYRMAKPLELSAADSGTEKAPIIYRATPGETVRLSGGRLVTGFKPVTDAKVLKRLDAAARGKVLQADVRVQGITKYGSAAGGGPELYFQDKPMTLARWPNQGFIKIVKTVGGKPFDVRGRKGDRIGKFVYEGDHPDRWVGEKDGWVHGYWFHDWSDQREKIASIDPAKHVLAVAPPYHSYGYRKGQWFYGYNLLCELDEPGEWYLDRQTGTLYFWPPAPIASGQPTVSVLDTMINARDASYVTFRDLTVEAARGTAVNIRDGSHDRLLGCTLRNIGNNAISVHGGTDDGVAGCDLYGLGGAGISLYGGDRRTLTPAGHWAENNHIHHYGLWYRMYRAGISLGGVGNRAVHNLIHDAPHQAISFSGNDHRIELNVIHHVCTESNDAGAIYAGRDWTMRGTVIRHNFFHDISGFQNRGCVGVYLDDMFSGTEISGNVFYRVTRAAFVGGGRDCTIENNVFVDCKPAVHVDSRGLGWASGSVPTTMMHRLEAMPYKTPPWSTRYPRLVGITGDQPAAPKGNLITRNVSFGGRWDEVDKRARPYVKFQDNLVGEDPHFVDAAAMNFQLKDDSPVYKKLPGFQKIPFGEIGLVKGEYRKSLPKQGPE